MENILNDEQQFKAMSKQIERFAEFYQSQGLQKSKALELAVKSVGVSCEISQHDMVRD